MCGWLQVTDLLTGEGYREVFDGQNDVGVYVMFDQLLFVSKK